MIISVEKVKEYVDLDGWTFDRVKRKLKAIEQTIRAYTNNNFQNRSIRGKCCIVSNQINGSVPGLKVGDTVQISESRYNSGLFVILDISGETITVECDALIDESGVLVTKIEYPDDVVDCCINLLEWEKNNRSKVGIQSETLSRHSVTYFNQDYIFNDHIKGNDNNIASATGNSGIAYDNSGFVLRYVIGV